MEIVTESRERRMSSEGGWMKVFLSNVRVLTEEEVARLPLEKRESAEGYGVPGIWVEVLCPENACVTSDDRVTLPAPGTSARKGRWLELFCPEEQCVIESPSELP